MRLLLIDTCGQEGSFALADTDAGSPVLTSVALGGRVASERLIPELRRAMAELGWRIEDLTAVGVVAGPGSFTGVRVGVAAAKGLCEAGAVPLVMVSRLAVLAGKAVGAGERVHALLDAGRGEFFYGRFEAGESSEMPVQALLSREAVLEAVAGGGLAVVCESVVAAEFAGLEPVMAEGLLAADAIGLVVSRVERRAFDDVASSDANYLRRTELEVQARLALRAAASPRVPGA